MTRPRRNNAIHQARWPDRRRRGRRPGAAANATSRSRRHPVWITTGGCGRRHAHGHEGGRAARGTPYSCDPSDL